ncbi:MAG: ACT domain-containing protein [Egibacteraceae bacterium]
MAKGPLMHKDFTLIPDDQPGVLARIGEAAGEAGINIEGISAFTGEGRGVVHLLVRDPADAQRALTAAGFDVRAARDVLVVDIADRPGAMGEVCRRLADHDVNIQQAYIAGGGTSGGYRLVLAVDDIAAARALM